MRFNGLRKAFFSESPDEKKNVITRYHLYFSATELNALDRDFETCNY